MQISRTNYLTFFYNLGPRQTPYKVLVLNTVVQDTARYNFDIDDSWYRMLSFSALHDGIGNYMEMQILLNSD